MTDRSLLAHRAMSGSVAAELAMEFPAPRPCGFPHYGAAAAHHDGMQ
jgi:hypothetical protein